jgi:hypothetical protein
MPPVLDQDILPSLSFGSEGIENTLQITAMTAIDIGLELGCEIEAGGIDAEGHRSSGE